jgi:hypothetical protein
MFARTGVMRALNRYVERVSTRRGKTSIGDDASWRGINDGSKRVFGLPITLEGEARRQTTPWSMAAASGQLDRIPSIEAPPVLYRQLASQAPSRRRSARIAQMNWTDPCYNLTPRRSKLHSIFGCMGRNFFPAIWRWVDGRVKPLIRLDGCVSVLNCRTQCPNGLNSFYLGFGVFC